MPDLENSKDTVRKRKLKNRTNKEKRKWKYSTSEEQNHLSKDSEKKQNSERRWKTLSVVFIKVMPHLQLHKADDYKRKLREKFKREKGDTKCLNSHRK